MLQRNLIIEYNAEGKPSFLNSRQLQILVVFLYGSIDLFNEALNKRQRLGYEHGLSEKNMFDVSCNC